MKWESICAGENCVVAIDSDGVPHSSGLEHPRKLARTIANGVPNHDTRPLEQITLALSNKSLATQLNLESLKWTVLINHYLTTAENRSCFRNTASRKEVVSQFVKPCPMVFAEQFSGRATNVAAGAVHSLVVKLENGSTSVHSTGHNGSEQLGLGDNAERQVLIKIQDLDGKDIQKVAAGRFHS
ncbi:unnamed protein product [Cylindrotheca closterium]|uniref:Uncharacterized protein n=1 Tax=Cylindrotheca closterium TaxID=2856 RepID=A0AAD2FWT5_9STRA|nr:unnamed protein product [Cylindrotheca closterium]